MRVTDDTSSVSCFHRCTRAANSTASSPVPGGAGGVAAALWLMTDLLNANLSDGPKVLRQPRAGAVASASAGHGGRLLAHHLEQPQFQPRRLGHHVAVPRRVEDELDLDCFHARQA